LVVDDNAVALKATSRLLQMAGHQVVGASDGRSALEAAREFNPEKVLLDLSLPGMDGYEVVKQLRELDGMEKAIFIAVTGYGEEQQQRAQQAGFHHYVTKPINIELIEKLFSSDSDEPEAPCPIL
jgi:two-component system CheB/CheR fusion protein